jgi:hypothetical protein
LRERKKIAPNIFNETSSEKKKKKAGHFEKVGYGNPGCSWRILFAYLCGHAHTKLWKSPITPEFLGRAAGVLH